MQDQFRQLVERSAAGTWQVGEDGVILYANPAMARLLEVAGAAELQRRPFADFISPDGRAIMADAHRLWLAGAGGDDPGGAGSGCRSREVQLLGHRGARPNALACGAPLGDGTLVVTFTELPADLTRVNEHLLRSARMESIGRLAGGVAHDFNNLLAVISGYGEALLRRTEPASVDQPPHPLRQHVEEIHRAALRGAALVQQLLAFSRRQSAAPRVMDLSETVRGVYAMLRPVLGRAIETRISVDQRLPITADPGQIEQVVVNLAINGRDAMPRGGELTITTAAAEAPPGLPAAGRRCARLTVTDTGAGMDADTTARIFEPFFSTKGNAGSGLGLSIVYGIVQQAGGQITVRSEPGQGTEFDVYFPLAQ